jgi:hypothetical protein
MKAVKFKGVNPIIESYLNGDSCIVLEADKNNPFRLTRFRKKYGTTVTGKEIGGVFCVVFWENLIKQNDKINGDK